MILVGHLGKDPDRRILEDQVTVVSFPLATCTVIKKNGVNQEETEWHNIILWRDMAETASKMLSKGQLICVEGKVQTRSFEKDGIKRYVTEVVAQNFTLLGRKSDFLV